MEKKGFGFYQDVKVNVWRRQFFTIEAETEAEAIEIAKRYGDEDVSDDYDVDNSEYLYETETRISPSENKGCKTIEVFHCASPWEHNCIADNAVADFTPMNETLLHKAIADITFNIGWIGQGAVGDAKLVAHIIQWAKEFEKIHRGTEWASDGDYDREVDKYANKKYYEYMGGNQ